MMSLISNLVERPYATGRMMTTSGGLMSIDVVEGVLPEDFGTGQGVDVPRVDVTIRRGPVPKLTEGPYGMPKEIHSLEQGIAAPSNRLFRALDRHTRWETVFRMTHVTETH
jgi:hypothetical protein